MALRKCKECGGSISTQAKVCPQCGAPAARKTARSTWLILLLIVVVAGGSMLAPDNPKTVVADSTVPTPIDPRQTRIEKHFSAWDGSHVKLKRSVVEKLKDPDSFEHIETAYKDNKDETLTVSMKYRAKNSFNGFVIETVIALVHIDGDVIQIVSID